AAVGSITYPRLRQAGYSERFASALIVSECALDNLIPPSIAFILYGIATETSVAALFAAGIVPGLVLGGIFALYIYAHSFKENIDVRQKFSWPEFLAASRQGIWPLGAIVVIFGGIYSGVFSPTEAAGVSCVYAIFVAMVIYREVGFAELFQCAGRTLFLTGTFFLIVSIAGMFGWLLTIFVFQALFKTPSNVLFPGLIPFVILAIVALMLVTYIPALSLFILPYML